MKHKLEYNIYSAAVTWCPICNEHFYNQLDETHTIPDSTPTVEDKQDEWISVEDELPKNTKNVIVAGNVAGRILTQSNTGYYKNGRWYDSGEDLMYSKTFITHWQPLPAPPKTNTITKK